MKYRLKIEVSLKPGHSDPEGETTADLLKELGYRVEAVNVGKVYIVILEASSRKEAQAEAVEMCKRLLANPTKDDYAIRVEETR
ncbi:MAG TPA: phosphoribosylformylglycinamidine synthase subunit PurS [candidate division Zixibacteria bacterium]|nr:phosphoribosylformylglycinamidine synthase subunit PurS [candidate division Zixibacteria bacterium]